MSVLLILWRKSHVTLHWKLGRKLIKENIRLQHALGQNIFCSCLFVVCFLSHICLANGNTLVHSKNTKDEVDRRKQHQNDNGNSPPIMYNKSVRNAVNNNMLNVTGLSKYREKLNKKNLFTTNHRKSIFKRESNKGGKLYFISNLENDILNVNKAIFDNKEYASSWAVKIPENAKNSGIDPEDLILRIADEVGLISHGTIGHLVGHFLLVHHTFYDHTPDPDEKLIHLRKSITERLHNHPYIDWVNHETVQKRYKRSLEFKDQFFPSQWHLVSVVFIFGLKTNIHNVSSNFGLIPQI